ncbi:hypothetical protein FAGKG844_340023 [Frankia sp. AgKG'84/4]
MPVDGCSRISRDKRKNVENRYTGLPELDPNSVTLGRHKRTPDAAATAGGPAVATRSLCRAAGGSAAESR